MKISEAIQSIKAYHRGTSRGEPIDPAKTRDQILYGDPERELTGVVTTCFASYEVIAKAIDAGANLVICHEALFWNHGDHTDWLQDNKTFQAKAAPQRDQGHRRAGLARPQGVAPRPHHGLP